MGIIKLFTANRFLLYDRIIRAKTKRYVATSPLDNLAETSFCILKNISLRFISLN